MVKILEFSINLDTNREVFYGGENISGHVRLVLTKTLKLRGLTLEFKGKGYCHWTETRGSGRNSTIVSFTGREDIFRLSMVLAGHPNTASSSSTIEMQPDTYHYPFTFQLPMGIPTSFEGHRGHIRYSLVGCVDKPGKFDHHTRKIITVNEIMDTNLPQFIGAEYTTNEKMVGCLCCLTGPVSGTLSIDRKAYCPGEMINVTARCDNRSSRNMTSIKVKLIKTIAYISSRKTIHEHETVSSIEGPPVPPRQFADWNNQGLLIPAIAPTITGSKVVNVTYSLRMHVNIPMAIDLKSTVPVTIGTVPFRGTYMNPATHIAPASNLLPFTGPPPTGSNFGYPDMPPPSYVAATGSGAKNTEDEVLKNMHSDAPYVPLYTYAYPAAPFYPPAPIDPSVHPPQ